MVRPTIDIDVNEVRRLAKLGLTLEKIALCLGISSKTLSRRKKVMSVLSDALKAGQVEAEAEIANALYQSALEGSPVAQKFYLAARCGWREKSDVEVSSTQPVQVIIKNDLKD